MRMPGAVRSGTVSSRDSLSSTSASALSTASRNCTLPGTASNVTEPPAGAVVDDAAAASGDLPRKYGEPSGATAVTDMRAATSVALAGLPGARGTGSQTSVTRVLPPAPRSVPIQVRTRREDRIGVVMVASAVVTAFGSAGFAGSSARLASSAVKAQ